jgi:hypothetical protein
MMTDLELGRELDSRPAPLEGSVILLWQDRGVWRVAETATVHQDTTEPVDE